ncbi:hypothetical protein BKA82DRAFT_1005757 [Pisolithus tinctorius]|uniref:Uncharacterized protein n=1 Tax=Pisolithus tinctorius Marx 270 TaxID=870435 RepID=A0A0C3NQX4_PISTI|nr:hypothetical protein BKA82DRAFT_1005757 [Pisolithus tinctorius]KIN97905.1 hypothetical protein M404DRAFT_1005757 [Pisolithus tinctorius Marx 270]
MGWGTLGLRRATFYAFSEPRPFQSRYPSAGPSVLRLQQARNINISVTFQVSVRAWVQYRLSIRPTLGPR